MSNPSWFFASQGKQQGPYPEARLREFIANGTVTAETLVWTEGMAGWQKAGDIPGLRSGTSGPPVVPGAGTVLGSGAPAGRSLSVDLGIWDFIWRTLVLFIGLVLVIPVPWVIVMYCRWIVSCTHVPDRPNLTFSGGPVNILCALSIITIIGWAWVYTAQMRWMCRHVEGTRREIVFNATGLEFLWRSLVTGLGCIFIVTIPWVMRWFIRWQVSQVALVERGTRANA